jgi:hypothetical protein
LGYLTSALARQQLLALGAAARIYPVQCPRNPAIRGCFTTIDLM